MPADTWLPFAHSPIDRGSSGVLCIVWHEEHDIVRRSSRASLKHGESINPLYSRPDTRIIPSDQNESLSAAGSASTIAFIVAESRFVVGCRTKCVSSRSRPGRYGGAGEPGG